MESFKSDGLSTNMNQSCSGTSTHSYAGAGVGKFTLAESPQEAASSSSPGAWSKPLDSPSSMLVQVLLQYFIDPAQIPTEKVGL